MVGGTHTYNTQNQPKAIWLGSHHNEMVKYVLTGKTPLINGLLGALTAFSFI